jgi:hypothetical protein
VRSRSKVKSRSEGQRYGEVDERCESTEKENEGKKERLTNGSRSTIKEEEKEGTTPTGEANLRDDFPHQTKSHFFVFLWRLRFSSPICVLTQKKINEERIEVLLTFESLEKPSNMLIFKFPALSIILSMTAGLTALSIFLFYKSIPPF